MDRVCSRWLWAPLFGRLVPGCGAVRSSAYPPVVVGSQAFPMLLVRHLAVCVFLPASPPSRPLPLLLCDVISAYCD